jgi:hypothetical protein
VPQCRGLKRDQLGPGNSQNVSRHKDIFKAWHRRIIPKPQALEISSNHPEAPIPYFFIIKPRGYLTEIFVVMFSSWVRSDGGKLSCLMKFLGRFLTSRKLQRCRGEASVQARKETQVRLWSNDGGTWAALACGQKGGRIPNFACKIAARLLASVWEFVTFRGRLSSSILGRDSWGLVTFRGRLSSSGRPRSCL